MRVTCGTDIIEIERVKRAIGNSQGDFLDRVFTEREIKYCDGKKQVKYQHFAGRFASKEAIFKTIASAFEDKYLLSWKDIEIINDKTGKPYVNFLENKPIELDSIDISISHCKDYAVAYAVAVWKGEK